MSLSVGSWSSSLLWEYGRLAHLSPGAISVLSSVFCITLVTEGVNFHRFRDVNVLAVSLLGAPLVNSGSVFHYFIRVGAAD